MVAILHNLLDNAIEANGRIPEGEKVTFRTRKEQKEEHGIGPQIIESVIQKLHMAYVLLRILENLLYLSKEVSLYEIYGNITGI